MKRKWICLLLALTLLLSCAPAVMAEETTASVTFDGLNVSYNDVTYQIRIGRYENNEYHMGEKDIIISSSDEESVHQRYIMLVNKDDDWAEAPQEVYEAFLKAVTIEWTIDDPGVVLIAADEHDKYHPGIAVKGTDEFEATLSLYINEKEIRSSLCRSVLPRVLTLDENGTAKLTRETRGSDYYSLDVSNYAGSVICFGSATGNGDVSLYNGSRLYAQENGTISLDREYTVKSSDKKLIFEVSENDKEGTFSATLTLTPPQPELYAKSCKLDGSENTRVNTSVSGIISVSSYWRFYYGMQDGNDILLTPENTTVTYQGDIDDAVTLKYDSDKQYYVLTGSRVDNGELCFSYNGSELTIPASISLLAVGVYSEPIRQDIYAISPIISGDFGEEKTAYIMWDPQRYESPSLQLDTVTTVLEEENGTITVGSKSVDYEYNAAAGYVKLSTVLLSSNINLRCNVSRKSSSGNSTTSVQFVPNKPGNLVVDDITYGLVTKNNGPFASTTIYGPNISTSNKAFSVAAIQGYGTDYASNVSLAYLCNVVGLNAELVNFSFGDTDAVNVEVTQEDDLWSLEIVAEEDTYYEAYLRYTLTVKNAAGEVISNTSYFKVNWYPSTKQTVILDEEDYDTAEELNALFGADKTVEDLLDELLDDAQTAAFKTAEKTPELTIQFPGGYYDGIIVYSVKSEYGSYPRNTRIHLIGAVDENGENATTIPGLVVTGGIIDTSAANGRGTQGASLMWVNNLNVVNRINEEGDTLPEEAYYLHSSRETNEDFTFGILADTYSSIGTVRWANISGFDYGMYATETGNMGSCSMNVLSDNGVGLYWDSRNCWNGSVTDARYTRFENNGTAILIHGLPDFQTVYQCRVTLCDFIANDMDFQVDIPGWFYFYKNYFEDDNGQRVDNTRGNLTMGTQTTVYTHPRRFYPVTDADGEYSDYYFRDNSPLYVANGDGTYTALNNNEADDLLIAKAESGALLPVVDENNEILGTWEF